MTVYDDLAQRIHQVARHHARNEAPPPMRFKITSTDPYVLDQLDGDLVLTEGDPDVTIADSLDMSGPGVDDMVLVHQVGPGDNPEYVASHVIARGDDDQ